MRAVIADRSPDLVRLAAVAAPVPAAGEVLVDVSAISVNRGELHRLRDADAGWRPGWDFAGTVAAGANGPFQAGQRVVGIAGDGGAWAEQVSVPVDHLAALTPEIDDEPAAALPVAGVTALRVLRMAGELAGRRVLVTGAAGGVGGFAVQLAAAAGAEVVAMVGRPEHATRLFVLGAVRIIIGPDSLTGEYDVVLESAGGSSLTDALTHVAPGGLVVTFGNSSRTPAAIPVSEFYPKQAALRGYHLLHDLQAHPPARDLVELVELAARGRLRVDLHLVRDVEELPCVLHALAERRLTGKAVLRMR